MRAFYDSVKLYVVGLEFIWLFKYFVNLDMLFCSLNFAIYSRPPNQLTNPPTIHQPHTVTPTKASRCLTASYTHFYLSFLSIMFVQRNNCKIVGNFNFSLNYIEHIRITLLR